MKSSRSFTLALVVAALLAMPATRPSIADTLGVGTFELDADLSSFLPAPMTGTVTWNNSPQAVFGTPVNLGLQIGSMTLQPGSALLTAVQGSPLTGTYTATLASASPGVLNVSGNGDYVCSLQGCTSGAPNSFIGTDTALAGSFAATLPPGLTYTAEGGAGCCLGGGCVPPVLATVQHCEGIFAVNAFEPSNTGTGNNLPVLPLSGTFYNTLTNMLETRRVDVDFRRVTSAGTTVFTATSNDAGTIPPNFQVSLPGFQPIYFDVSTTAVFNGTVEICSYYPDSNQDGLVDGTSVPETQLRLLHRVSGQFDPNTPGRVDPVENKVCASVTSFSPFVVAVQSAAAIPSTATILKCESAVAKNAGKLAQAIVKCRVKGATAAFKAKPFDEGACELAARAKYADKNAKLTGCPDCLLGEMSALGDVVQSTMGNVSLQAYCEAAPPSCTTGTGCGSCGTGFCVDHCDGTTVIGSACVTSDVGPHCFDDSDCLATPSMPYCISNGFCGGPDLAATCRALCN